MATLLAFVLFGIVLSNVIGTADLLPSLALAALVIFVIRPGALGIVLSRAKMSLPAHAFISWFGPRGLNSLLLALLAVQAAIPGAEFMLATVGVVVLASVAIHGASATPLSAWYGRKAANETLEEERESTAAGLFTDDESDVPLITIDELYKLLAEDEPPTVLDVRSRSSYESDGYRIPGDVRLLPDQVKEWGPQFDGSNMVVAYCS